MGELDKIITPKSKLSEIVDAAEMVCDNLSSAPVIKASGSGASGSEASGSEASGSGASSEASQSDSGSEANGLEASGSWASSGASGHNTDSFQMLRGARIVRKIKRSKLKVPKNKIKRTKPKTLKKKIKRAMAKMSKNKCKRFVKKNFKIIRKSVGKLRGVCKRLNACKMTVKVQ
ncbi:predicted protein [Nematostella vectensis]|uniref:Uncharacterized protein n=1 Tax=Nematostella vectensis TaxID=45351 RepID=A7SAR2_NEMVE|nr:predicted protein [Nematostella vectensis]|eukprot:XP_001631230.1 predicted protein [Nematostella vectensis]